MNAFFDCYRDGDIYIVEFSQISRIRAISEDKLRIVFKSEIDIDVKFGSNEDMFKQIDYFKAYLNTQIKQIKI
jgi:hypothetical protein